MVEMEMLIKQMIIITGYQFKIQMMISLLVQIQWSTDDDSNLNFTDLIDKINSDKGDTTSYPSNGNHFYSERVDLVHNDTKPVYSVRGTLPILDYGQDGEVWFKIEHIGKL